MLEARARLGGRMFTGGDDNILEFGAQWIQVRDVEFLHASEKKFMIKKLFLNFKNLTNLTFFYESIILYSL